MWWDGICYARIWLAFFTIQTDNLYLLIGMFRPFTSNVTVDIFWFLSVILLFVFFVPSGLCSLLAFYFKIHVKRKF